MNGPQQNTGMLVMLGISLIGGLFVGKMVADQAFREGLTEKERRNILVFSGGLVGWYAIGKLLDLDERWYDMGALIENPPVEAQDLLPK